MPYTATKPVLASRFFSCIPLCAADTLQKWFRLLPPLLPPWQSSLTITCILAKQPCTSLHPLLKSAHVRKLTYQSKGWVTVLICTFSIYPSHFLLECLLRLLEKYEVPVTSLIKFWCSMSMVHHIFLKLLIFMLFSSAFWVWAERRISHVSTEVSWNYTINDGLACALAI